MQIKVVEVQRSGFDHRQQQKSPYTYKKRSVSDFQDVFTKAKKRIML